MTRTTGQKLGKEICEAVGLDPNNVHSLTLHCDVSAVATLDVVTFVRSDAVDGLVRAVAKYRLEEL